MSDIDLINIDRWEKPLGAVNAIFETLPVSFHFLVSFIEAGVLPNPIDIRFQTVSGLSSEIEIEEIQEGGLNIYKPRIPTRVIHENLILERGMVIGSPLTIQFSAAMNQFKLVPTSTVLIMLLNQDNIPLSCWSFYLAYPVKWTISDLDANENSVVIETMELAYQKFKTVRL